MLLAATSGRSLLGTVAAGGASGRGRIGSFSAAWLLFANDGCADLILARDCIDGRRFRAAARSTLFFSSSSSSARCASSDSRGWVAVPVRAHSGTTYFLRSWLTPRTGDDADMRGFGDGARLGGRVREPLEPDDEDCVCAFRAPSSIDALRERPGDDAHSSAVR